MEASSRVAVALLLALGVWVVAYWLTPPREPAATSAAPGDAELESFEPAVSFAREPVRGAAADGGEAADTDAEEEPVARAERVDGAGEGTRVIAPEFDSYVVRAGDTPNRISRRLYGTDRYWASILRANPLKDLHRGLRAGMTIRVPRDPENVQGIVVAGSGGDENAGDAETAEGRAGVPTYVEYTVRRGDTLTGIAQRVYGRSGLWTLIRDANQERTGEDGTRIRPGMVLRLPPKPAG